MEEGITVCSLFDGMSCGQIALSKTGIIVKSYFASEIDKFAIKVVQENYPNTIQLGDVKDIDPDTSFANCKIDLLIGGSPCQGFSKAGKMLGFEDPRSRLFYEFLRIKEKTNPDFFLLENVLMRKEDQDIISNLLGVSPFMINSSLVSAQNRKRLYWTNIPIKEMPKDRNLILKDVLEKSVDNKYFISNKLEDSLLNHSLKTGNRFKIKADNEKSSTLSATIFKTNLQNDYIIQRKPIQINPSKESGGKQPYQQNRIYDSNALSPALTANLSIGSHFVFDSQIGIRRLTPTECERLQTVPEGYTDFVSDTQRYKMLGNGWTVDVIAHIFSFLPFKKHTTCKK